MNKTQLVLAAIPAALAMAAPNLALGGKQGKVHIHHCGCAEDGLSLICKEMTVNLHSVDKHGAPNEGHANHTVGSEVYCTASEMTHARTKEDCGHSALAGGSTCDAVADECSQANVDAAADCTMP